MGILINFMRKLVAPSKKLLTNTYLLEYRYSGYPKKYFLDRFLELNRTYKITHPIYHYVPHITIAGPIITNHEFKLIEVIKDIIFRNAPNFHEPGNLVGTGKYIKFDTDVGGKVLAIGVIPPKSLVNLKKEIYSNLNTIKNFKCQIYKKEIWHTTLWNMKRDTNSNKNKFQHIWNNLKNSPQEMKFILDRITLIKNAKILKEFDVVNLKICSRTYSLNNNVRYESYLKIKSELESKGEFFKY